MSEQIAAPPQPRRIPPPFDQRWTADEIMALRVAWRDPNVTNEDIPGLLRERSLKAARHMANLLGLGPRPKPEKPGKAPPPELWTERDDTILRAMWHTTSRQEIAAKVGRTPHSVSHRACKLDLGRSEYARKLVAERAAVSIAKARAKKPAPAEWTAEQVQCLRDLWPDIETINRLTGRSRSGIERKAHNLRMPPKSGYPKAPLPTTAHTAKAETRLTIRHEPVPVIRRKCLCCGVGFDAASKFLRMCPPCRGRA